ncbi:MAG: type II secretion system protein GspE, partial [bacterium]|nr:type II secretion system protein GspE [bacterium]
GHAGRAGIFELLELNKDIHDAIITHASAEHIREIAEKNGYRPMIDDGVAKVLAGYTTFDEIIRVTRNS